MAKLPPQNKDADLKTFIHNIEHYVQEYGQYGYEQQTT